MWCLVGMWFADVGFGCRGRMRTMMELVVDGIIGVVFETAVLILRGRDSKSECGQRRGWTL